MEAKEAYSLNIHISHYSIYQSKDQDELYSRVGLISISAPERTRSVCHHRQLLEPGLTLHSLPWHTTSPSKYPSLSSPAVLHVAIPPKRAHSSTRHPNMKGRTAEAHLVPQRSPKQYEQHSAISSPLRLLYGKSTIREREGCPVSRERLSRGFEGRPVWRWRVRLRGRG